GLDNDCDGDTDALDSDLTDCGDDPICGDGIVDNGEECDDGNDIKYDACNKCEVRTQHYAWPQAGGPYGPWTIEDDAQKSFGLISMPNDWTGLDGRQVYATLAHELGHTLSLGDLYAPEVPGRNMAGWDLMHAETRIPHLSISQRLALGWLDPDDIYPFNPATDTEATVRLSPAGRVQADPGRRIGVEVRLGPGWNYYFEYRLRQPGHIGDHGGTIPQAAPGQVLGSDRISNRSDAAFDRPSVLLAPVVPGSDGPALSIGDVFSQPDPPALELRVEVVDADEDEAEVHIQYATFRPDPSIRPWAGPSWQSPDIEVRNAKSLADPDTWANVPWAGEKNTLVAKVHNGGNEDAPDVQVDFYVKNFNVSGAPAMYVGSATEDVPAGATVEVVCADCWQPPVQDNPHFCVVAEIMLYQHPVSLAVEATQFNNIAQSNYAKFWSDSASPARRVRHTVEVGNPFDHPAVVLVDAGQTHPHFRTYVAHRWLRLGPNEVRPVEVMYEYTRDLENELLEQREQPSNAVHLRAFGLDLEFGLEQENTLPVLGGVTAAVETGFRTEVVPEVVEQGGSGFEIHAAVRTAAPQQLGLPGGRAVATVRYANGDVRYFSGDVGDGEMRIRGQPPGMESIDIEYLGDGPNAPSRLEGWMP
ncbi:MAG: DUF4215 domain-containing protein, partial [Myxococcales bacterium]|nr:DUF4215 domain-containing protein [Myxococcales bacterium]